MRQEQPIRHQELLTYPHVQIVQEDIDSEKPW